jgi:hypothetical protein
MSSYNKERQDIREDEENGEKKQKTIDFLLQNHTYTK